MTPELQQKIDKIKEAGLPVFSIKLGNTKYIYRGLNRREFRELQAKLASMAEQVKAKFSADEPKMNSELALLKERGEEQLVLKCIIEPIASNEADIDSIPAGVVSRLADLIMKSSGFEDGEPEEPKQL